MKITRIIMACCCLLSVSCFNAAGLKSVRLEDYGPIDNADAVFQTFTRAFADISGKRLVLPGVRLEIDRDLVLRDAYNFELTAMPGSVLECRRLLILDSHKFSVSGLSVFGKAGRFASFDIMGNCSGFEVANCVFDSEKGPDGLNMFYGMHIACDGSAPNPSYENSPRSFRIHDNTVCNSRYDGILVHAHCSDFVVENNMVTNPQCIGIEVEGRLGDNTHTTVHRCRNGAIRSNTISGCGDWGILLMWSDGISVTDNVSTGTAGTFLSIGCTRLKVRRNHLEGTKKGFEISQEFYAVDKGINEHIVVRNNEIACVARADGRGAVDIRHSRDVVFRGNTVTLAGRPSSGAVNVSSSVDVRVTDNTFTGPGELPPFAVICDNVKDPETGIEVPLLDLANVRILRNKLPEAFRESPSRVPVVDKAVTVRNTFRKDNN